MASNGRALSARMTLLKHKRELVKRARKIAAKGGYGGFEDVRAQFETLGTYARPLPPEDTVAFIKGEQELWRPLLEQLGKVQ